MRKYIGESHPSMLRSLGKIAIVTQVCRSVMESAIVVWIRMHWGKLLQNMQLVISFICLFISTIYLILFCTLEIYGGYMG